MLWHTTCARDAALSQLDLRSPPLLGCLYYRWAQYEFILVDSKTGPNSNTIDTVTNTGTTAPSPSPSGSSNNNNPFDDISPLKKNAALPQVAVASGLMVTAAFLSVFLVSSSHTNLS